MMEIWTSLVLIICINFSLVCTNGLEIKHYTNKWIVHVPFGEIAAREVARSNNMTYEGPNLQFDGYYYMARKNIPIKSFNHIEAITNRLKIQQLVSTAFHEVVKLWSYRDKFNSSYVVSNQLLFRSKYRNAFNDERWLDMWYLQDYRIHRIQPVLDLNVVKVYEKYQITGENVNITVVDSGIEYSHPEIEWKFNPEISWNFIQNNKNIIPDKDSNGTIKSHGTKCAGIIVMKPNNKICGIGIAYGARLGGIKLLSNNLTYFTISMALKYALNNVDIYSNSWGDPNMYPLKDIVKSTLYFGVKWGRRGKGVIYVFAVGNKKKHSENCACDCYVNSIYTIAVASCDDSGHPTYYSERCAAIMAVAYGGNGKEANILTSNVNGGCTDKFIGNSATTPMVSGVIGLALSANPSLTWRDILHLLTWTSQVAPLSDNLGWNKNNAGFYYSVDFGFGLINTYRLVRKATNWVNVPKMNSCGIRFSKVYNYSISRKKGIRIIIRTDCCKGLINEVNFIEQIQLVVTMTYSKKEDIQIAMKSPAGTEIHVLESRKNKTSTKEFNKWPFKVLAFWGESPRGDFVIDIYDNTGPSTNKGNILKMDLIIHGTKDRPAIYENGPRKYERFNLASEDDKPKYLKLGSLRKLYIHNKKAASQENNIKND